MFLNSVKSIYYNLTENTILNGGKRKIFPSRKDISKSYLLLPLLFNTVLDFLVIAIRKEKGLRAFR